MQLKLVVRKGDRLGEELTVSDFPATFGKGEECTFRFNEAGVSRKHFVLKCEEAIIVIEDLQSTNGTYLNKDKVEAARPVHLEDFVVAGKMVFQVVVIEARSTPTIPVATSPIHVAHHRPAELHCPILVSKKNDTLVVQADHDIATEIPNQATAASPGSETWIVRRQIDIEKSSILLPEQNKLLHSHRALKTIYEIVQKCNSEPDHSLLFESLLLALFKAITADRGAIILKSSEDQHEGKTFLTASQKKDKFAISKTILADVLQNRVSIISTDPAQDARYRFAESLRVQRVASLVCAPLISYQKVFGAIYLDRTAADSRPFTQEDLEFLAAIGIQIGSSLEKSLLLAEVSRINSYLKAVIESVPVGIHTLDLSGIFTSWSSYSEKIFGHTATQIVNHAHVSLVFADPALFESILAQVHEKGLFSGEVMLKHKDGTTFPGRFALSRIMDAAENLWGYTGYHQNIADEKRIQEQIFAQEKMAALGVLAAGVAHDFNNILSLISGYASLSMEDPTTAPQYLPKVIAQIGRATDITSHLLQYSRQENKQFKSVSAQILLEEVLELVHKELYASSIQVVKNFSPLPPQKLIPGQIQEVFVNIILNARDAMPQSGTLTITTYVQDSTAVIKFTDTGKGIDPAYMPHLFEPFCSTKQKSQKSGTGLGLAISYQIVQKHQGKIEVQTEPGKGTTFTILLPLSSFDN